MDVGHGRPRNLRWFHAGPLLFGDWGTSRLYVLGLAFYYTGHASPTYLAVMSVLMAAVAWAYTVVCRCFPDGGGVYAASRKINPTLSVIGATLLLCDYIVTAALSGVEAFHYFGTRHALVVPLFIGMIVLIAVINWFGARSAGRLALVIAIAALAASGLIAVMCLPLVGEGLRLARVNAPGMHGPWERWESLVRIVLALSGVEAVANMTGLMKPPVERTAKRTIWPVLIEVVVLNLIFGIALTAIPSLRDVTTPDYQVYELAGGLDPSQIPPEVKRYRDTAMHLLSEESSSRLFGSGFGAVFAVVTSIIFGVLLLSAVNTAVMAMMSVLYSLGQDRELPRALTKLNYSGVPWIGLVIAAMAPAAVILVEADAKALGELYAIGVVGAIAMNLTCCAWNRELAIKRWERAGLWTVGGVMCLVELTIIVAKPNATIFASSVIVAVMAIRFVMGRIRPSVAVVPEPSQGWLALRQPPPVIEPDRPRMMLAARAPGLAAWAVDQAKKRKATLFAIFVRTLRVMDVQPGAVPRLDSDADAQRVLGTVAVLAQRSGVAFIPIYVASPEIADEVLDYTVTYGCDALIMGTTRRSAFARALEGDVARRIASMLPEGVDLIQRVADPYSPEQRLGEAGLGAGTSTPAGPPTPRTEDAGRVP